MTLEEVNQMMSERTAFLRKTAKYIEELPLSSEQKLEQVRRNMEIRRQNIEEIQEKNSENDSKAINDSPLNNKNESNGNFYIIDADVKYDTH
jgi:uncharacterized protein YigA (DUF484 family)